MSNTSIGFVITTFNRRNLLERAINSVLPQLLTNDKIIIIDDCSQDETESYSLELAKNNPQIIYFRMPKNSGVNAARQQAIAVTHSADCQWISYIDDDDYLTSEVRDCFAKDIEKYPEEKWLAYTAIDINGKQLSTYPCEGSYSYIEDYMGKRIVKGDYQHFLDIDIAKQCTFTTQFKNAEVWYFWCQVSSLARIIIRKEPGVVKEFLEEGITQSGFNREKQLEVAELKVSALKGKMSDKQYSKILRNFGKALIKSKKKKESRQQLLQAIKYNPNLLSAYKYLVISFF